MNSDRARLTVYGRKFLFMYHMKYLGVVFDKTITWRLKAETIAAKALRNFIRA